MSCKIVMTKHNLGDTVARFSIIPRLLSMLCCVIYPRYGRSGNEGDNTWSPFDVVGQIWAVKSTW